MGGDRHSIIKADIRTLEEGCAGMKKLILMAAAARTLQLQGRNGSHPEIQTVAVVEAEKTAVVASMFFQTSPLQPISLVILSSLRGSPGLARRSVPHFSRLNSKELGRGFRQISERELGILEFST